MRKRILVTVLLATVLVGCGKMDLAINDVDENPVSSTVEEATEENVATSEALEDDEISLEADGTNGDYLTGVLEMAPTKTFEEVFIPVAAIVDSYEEEQCLHYLNEVEDMLDSMGYKYFYEKDACSDCDIWIIVEDPDADAEIRIYGYYDEFANVNVSEEDIRYDLTCIEYQSEQYYGIVDTPNLYDEPCKHGIDDQHEVSDSCEYKNISWPENAITNVESTEDIRRFFFTTD